MNENSPICAKLAAIVSAVAVKTSSPLATVKTSSPLATAWRSQRRGDKAADQGCHRAARKHNPTGVGIRGKAEPASLRRAPSNRRYAVHFKVPVPALTRPSADIVATAADDPGLPLHNNWCAMRLFCPSRARARETKKIQIRRGSIPAEPPGVKDSLPAVPCRQREQVTAPAHAPPRGGPISPTCLDTTAPKLVSSIVAFAVASSALSTRGLNFKSSGIRGMSVDSFF